MDRVSSTLCGAVFLTAGVRSARGCSRLEIAPFQVGSRPCPASSRGCTVGSPAFIRLHWRVETSVALRRCDLRHQRIAGMRNLDGLSQISGAAQFCARW